MRALGVSSNTLDIQHWELKRPSQRLPVSLTPEGQGMGETEASGFSPTSTQK